VAVIGIGAEGLAGLSPHAAEAVRSATFLAGGRRHLELAAPTAAETFVIRDNLGELVERLARRGPDERCVVLASGDPLFFGIGHRLAADLGRDAVRVEPAVSSLQLAFARAGVSWHDAAVGSVHGRPLKPALLPLLGRPKIGLFSRDGDSPSEVARFFLDRGLTAYTAWVCERLNAKGERVVAAPLSEIVGRRFDDLNVVILLREGGPADGPRAPDDREFARPASGPVLLTHEDVRSLVLRRFRGLVEGPVWDIGAGLGGVSVELARAFPSREVVAVERSDERLAFLRQNRVRFEAYNLRILPGEAPECLAGEEEPPAGVFLGGTGSRLAAILDLLAARLRPSGRVVADFVGLENLHDFLAGMNRLGWPTELTQVQINVGQALAGLTALAPQRLVWVVRASRPPGPRPALGSSWISGSPTS
jgi:precorrin-6Y C5,15-methyltransferase (decarboxylating)